MGEGRRHTNKFLTCTNTLGALTTAIVVSFPAPRSNSSAKRVAVSSEYYPHPQHYSPNHKNQRQEKGKSYPKLALPPILRKSIHTPHLGPSLSIILLGYILQVLELL
jgi:hypothetical protein